ncbi:hypothetical protein PIB30_061511 [Stylosanthes scabra]|uniref:Bifunctional inhibitor/plant lipid transfer protein/seed storage helical domain-containing protein n=1 Tax=Stylosanthes scabra TaxID=79078 RepID=A0ABU6UNV1_9FABA|nr:hypothetical protein [Stylosanthes scabra]
MDGKWVTLHLMVVAAVVTAATMTKGSSGISVCNMSEDGLMACKPSVTQPNPTDPTTECCNAVSAADLQCLCSYKNSVQLPFLGIDPDLAIALPAKCNLKTPVGC